MGRPVTSALKRFFDRVNPTENGCWTWTGYLDKDGYGKFYFEGQNRPAHRIAWQLLVGPIPTNYSVLHQCDNPPCVNVEHLFLGTHADNMADKAQKGRAYWAGVLPPSPQSAKTQCPEGHFYSGENLIIRRQGRWQKRECRACRTTHGRQNARERYRRLHPNSPRRRLKEDSHVVGNY